MYILAPEKPQNNFMNNMLSLLTVFLLSITANAQNVKSRSSLVDPLDSFFSIEDFRSPSGKVKHRFKDEEDYFLLSEINQASSRVKSTNASEPVLQLDSSIVTSANGNVVTKVIDIYEIAGKAKKNRLEYRADSEDESTLLPYRRYTYEYDKNENFTLYMQESWNKLSDEWNTDIRVETSYYNENHYSSDVAYKWNSDLNELTGWYKDLFEYSNEGKLIKQTSYNWNIEMSNWNEVAQITQDYNANCLLNQKFLYWWNDGNADWRLSQKTIHEYDKSGNLISAITYTPYAENDFIESIKYVYSYQNGFKTAEEYFEWNSELGDWNLSYAKREYEYNSNGKEILYVYYNRDEESGELIPVKKYINEYNEINRNILSESYEWNVELSKWKGIDYKFVSDFDSNGVRILDEEYSWNEDIMNWEAIYRMTSVESDDQSINSIKIYSSSELNSDVWSYDKKSVLYNGEARKSNYDLNYRWDIEINDWSAEHYERKDYYFTFVKGTQDITFIDELSIDENVEFIDLTATSSANLTVTYSSSDESVATVDGSKLKILKLHYVQ